MPGSLPERCISFFWISIRHESYAFSFLPWTLRVQARNVWYRHLLGIGRHQSQEVPVKAVMSSEYRVYEAQRREELQYLDTRLSGLSQRTHGEDKKLAYGIIVTCTLPDSLTRLPQRTACS